LKRKKKRSTKLRKKAPSLYRRDFRDTCDFGSQATNEATFVVQNNYINDQSLITISVDYDRITDKSLDDALMDTLVIAVLPAMHKMYIIIRSVTGSVYGKWPIKYFLLEK